MEVLKFLIYSQVKLLGGGFSFIKAADLEFIPAISLKGLRHIGFTTWVLHGSFFKIIGKFSAICLCKTFSNKVAGLQPAGCDFIENKLEMKTLHNFPYFLMHVRPLDVISNYNNSSLRGIYRFKVDNKNTRTR